MCIGFTTFYKTFKFMICIPFMVISLIVMSYFLGLVFKAAYLSQKGEVSFSDIWNRVNFYNPFNELTVWFGIIACISMVVIAFLICICLLTCGKEAKTKERYWQLESNRDRYRGDIIDVKDKESLGKAGRMD